MTVYAEWWWWGVQKGKGQKNMSELKPCPFCGRTPVVDDCGDNRYFVRCKCGIVQDKLYYQRCDAIRTWNRRKYHENQNN